MGADIHMWAEIRLDHAHIEDGVARERREREWHLVAPVFDDHYYTTEQPTYFIGSYIHNEKTTEHPYNRRNYVVFSILANVRNGEPGDATGHWVDPIALPRGVPDDLSKPGWERMKEYDHTPSWVALEELESYDWDGPMRVSGYVSPLQYLTFIEEGRPRHWAGGVLGAKVIDQGHMQRLIEANPPTGDRDRPDFGGPYTLVKWTTTRAVAADAFYSETLPALRAIRAMARVIDVRLIFYFDS